MPIEIVSADAAGNEGNNVSVLYSPGGTGISADGRYVAFYGHASNLVVGDTNGQPDVFVKDTLTGSVTRVSIDSVGNQGNSESVVPSISANGRFVAFSSSATNLVIGDTNATYDIFVKDTLTGALSRISIDSTGVQSNGFSFYPSVSGDGRFVSYESVATNLVSGDTNNQGDIFVRDTWTNTTTLVSTDSSLAQGNGQSSSASISNDGRYVSFASESSNLIAGDTNGQTDVFVKDTQTGSLTRVSTDSANAQGNGASSESTISSDGHYVAFSSNSSNLVAGDSNGTQDIFVKNTLTGATSRISTDSSNVQANGFSFAPSISDDGRYVTFTSSASNLVAGDTNGSQDVFVKDTLTGSTTRLSSAPDGTQGDSHSSGPSISGDGRVVAFTSIATNFVPGDTNSQYDVFAASAPYTALLSGDYWTGIERTNNPVFLTYSFPTAAPASHTGVASQMGFNVNTFQAFNAGEQAIALAALNQWANASGIVLLEVAPGQGQVNFAKYNLGAFGPVGSGGFAFNPFGTWNYTTDTGVPKQAHFFNDTGDGQSDGAGDVFINSNGTVTLGLMLHEIGHALGLKHPFDTVYSGTVFHDQTLDASLDNTANTVMSYTGAAPTVLGAYDIAAIQHIYGTNAQDGTQVQSWSWNAGTSTLTQTGFAAASNVMLGISTADIMTGGNLSDRLIGFSGNDSLDGGAGDDLLWGGRGNDTLRGGAGFDRFYADLHDPNAVQSDTVVDFVIGTDVIDLNDYGSGSFQGPASFEVLKNHLLRTDGSGNAILNGIWNGNLQTLTLQGINANSLTASDFTFVSFGPRNITGTSGDDQLWGGLSDDTLAGGNGADFFAGDAGNDSMSGGAGTDRFDGGAGADTFDGGAGLDRVDYNVATTLILNASGIAQAGSSSEALGDTFIGIEHIRGSALADTIDVSSAVPILSGFGGDDTLTGGVGTNEINGGDGDDNINGGGANGAAMIGDLGGTRIYEQLNGDAGNDTINVQTLTGQIAYANGGTGNDTINGGAGNDQITGGADNDQIAGDDGNDAIDGGTGADVLNGGNGNDRLTDSDGSASGDSYTGGAGADGLTYSTGTSFDFSAPGADTYDDTIEYIVFTNASTVTGTAGIDRFNGTGNNADHFSGLGGRDWLVGFGGNDTLEGGAENDRLDGGTGADIIRGGTGSDNLTGGNAGTTAGDGAADTFVFNVTTDMTVRDAIFDFEVGATNDRIGLEGTGLATGAWDNGRFFTTGQTINISGPVVIYDQASGLLSYDSDGNGAGGSTIFAVMLNHAAMTAANVTAI